MSLELKNVEKKVGIDTHIYSTNLKLEKNTINVLLGSTLAGIYGDIGKGFQAFNA